MATPSPASTHSDLRVARALTFGAVALAFPAATAAVFAFGADRLAVADALSVVYGAGLFLGFTAPLWPLPSLRDWSRARRLESVALSFVLVSVITHLSWELVWLVGHDAIIAARDQPWAYPWWAYIDGGDQRYADVPAELLAMETLSAINGVVGLVGLRAWRRGARKVASTALSAMAVVHLYSASLYFLTELYAGFPNVNTARPLDLWVKFTLANAPWLVFPPVVLWWARTRALQED